MQMVLRNGEVHYVEGYASNVQEKVNTERGKGKLVPFERTITPTGQMVWLDPDEVVSIRDDS